MADEEDNENRESNLSTTEDVADQTLDLPVHKTQRPATAKSDKPSFPPKALDKKYEFVRELGRGSMGQVYVYYETGIDREVAIKFQTHSDSEQAHRFHTEARIAASLQHPNVVTVLADGKYGDTPYIVFEYIDGKSLDKLGSAMPWTEVRKLGLQLASGLAAVHKKGLLHRDIKPANAMLLERDHQQIVKLIDFGVAKSTDAANMFGGSTGTPRYMSPEVWDDAMPTERSDVYSMGLTLYQLCTGEKPPIPPYDDDIRVDLPEIDSAFASVVNRCLERDPDDRFASGTELYNALLPLYSVKELLDIDVQQWIRNDRADSYLWSGRKLARVANVETENLPESHREFLRLSLARVTSVNRRKQLLAGLLLLAIVAAYIGVRYYLDRQLHRKVQDHLDEAQVQFERATEKHEQFDSMRAEALQLFRDRSDGVRAEQLWKQVLEMDLEISKPYRRAGQELEVALALDGNRQDVRSLLASILDARARLANDIHQDRERDEFLERLSVYDSDAYDAWMAPAQISVTISPPGATVSIQRMDPQTDGTLQLDTIESDTPVNASMQRAFEPGSYLLVVHADATYTELRYPFMVAFKETVRNFELTRIRRTDIPMGFVYVPGGTYYHGFGGRKEVELLRGFYTAAPLHRREIGPFFIARYETTFNDWIEFINSVCQQPGCADRPELLPNAGYSGLQTSLKFTDDGQWLFSYSNGNGVRDEARFGEKITFAARSSGYLAKQDWRQFPLVGVESKLTLEYLAWLDNTGRVAGARLCDEYEWERAGRGADTRKFPHGHSLTRKQANFDETHAGEPSGMGPDAVGAHPESMSPFGVHDMAGNVWELTSTPFEVSKSEPLVIRSGSYWESAPASNVFNRDRAPLERSVLVGFRVCADVADAEAPGHAN